MTLSTGPEGIGEYVAARECLGLLVVDDDLMELGVGSMAGGDTAMQHRRVYVHDLLELFGLGDAPLHVARGDHRRGARGRWCCVLAARGPPRG